MANRKWTEQEIHQLKMKVKFDERGFVGNTQELSELFGRSRKLVCWKVEFLRKKGELPSIYYDDPLYPIRRSYTEREDRFIVRALESGAYVEDIANTLYRSIKSIYHRIGKLRKNCGIDYRVRKWTKAETASLLNRIKFDEHGYLANVNELMRLTGRTRIAIYKKVELLRKDGEIKTLPDKSHTNQAGRAAHEYYYQLYVRTKKEPTPVPASEGLRKIN